MKTSPREISTQLSRCPYCYGLDYDNRLESVANAHTAADLHVRPVLKPRWSYDRGRREQFRNTRCVATRNAFDSTSERLIAAHLAQGFAGCSVTRKQVFESARKIAHPNGAVINDDELQKNIYKSFKQQP